MKLQPQTQRKHLLEYLSPWGANRHAQRATCTQGGLWLVLWRRDEKIGGGPSVGQNFIALKTKHVITKEVQMVLLPTGIGMIDTGCRSACGIRELRFTHLDPGNLSVQLS